MHWQKKIRILYWGMSAITTPVHLHPISQQWWAACRLAHASPSTPTCSRRSIGRWGIVWRLDSLSPPLLLCLLAPLSLWPPAWSGCALGRRLEQKCQRWCVTRGSCSCVGVGGQDLKHRGCCELWGEPGPPRCSRVALWTFLRQMPSSHLPRRCSGVHKDTPVGQSCQTWARHPVLSPLPAARCWHAPPPWSWIQRCLMESHWAVTAASSGAQRPAAEWGRWGGPGGRWRGSSPLRRQPGRGRRCGVCWPHSNPSPSLLCPLWLWAAGAFSWTAVWTAAAWLTERQGGRRSCLEPKSVKCLGTCRQCAKASGKPFSTVCLQFYSKFTVYFEFFLAKPDFSTLTRCGNSSRIWLAGWNDDVIWPGVIKVLAARFSFIRKQLASPHFIPDSLWLRM